MVLQSIFEKLHKRVLSESTKEKFERAILFIALISFIVHLIIIWLVNINVINPTEYSTLLVNPIAAIYTPFSFILVYEVYLLIYYLPKSITIYVSKQYEIITLIIIRRLFKDLSALALSSNWFSIKDDLQFTYDLVASVILFYLIYLFYINSKKKLLPSVHDHKKSVGIANFIRLKKMIATILVPVLFVIAIYSFLNWSISVIYPNLGLHVSFKNINNIFFEQFFNILIFADVILLLLSFFHTDEFHKVIRNSGFMISTILIRLSFSASGLLNTILIVSAIVFGLLILVIHNQFEKNIFTKNVNAVVEE